MPAVAVVTFVAIPGLVVLAAVASGTLGYDFLAYHQAATRVLDGDRLYDISVQQVGGFGLFYDPPPFVLAILPFALLPADVATWLWLGLSVAMLLAAIAILPVAPMVRWTTLLLAGLSWPVAYALKLGQVGPLLLAPVRHRMAVARAARRGRGRRGARCDRQDPTRSRVGLGVVDATVRRGDGRR